MNLNFFWTVYKQLEEDFKKTKKVDPFLQKQISTSVSAIITVWLISSVMQKRRSRPCEARDIELWVEESFNFKQVQGVDMFPHTHHVECISVLE